MSAVTEFQKVQKYIQSIRDLHKYLTMYVSQGEALVGERSAYNSEMMHFPVIALPPESSNSITSADDMLILYKITNEDTLEPRLYLSTTDAVGVNFSTDTKRVDLGYECTVNVSKIRSALVVRDYVILTKYNTLEMELNINFKKRKRSELLLSVPYSKFMNHTEDDIFQYSIIVPDYMILSDIYRVLMEYNMYMKCELDEIEKYSFAMKCACQKLGFI